MVVYVKIVRFSSLCLIILSTNCILLVGLGYRFYLLNYSNETSPGIPTLIAIINQTIINMTNGNVIATSISIR